MNDAEILNRIIDRYMEESGQDPAYAFRLLAYDFHRACSLASSGFARARPVAGPRFPAKAKAPSIEDLKPTDPEGASPSA